MKLGTEINVLKKMTLKVRKYVHGIILTITVQEKC